MQNPKSPPPADWQLKPAGQSVPISLQVCIQVDEFPIVMQRYPATQELMTLHEPPCMLLPLQSHTVAATVS